MCLSSYEDKMFWAIYSIELVWNADKGEEMNPQMNFIHGHVYMRMNELISQLVFLFFF